MYGKQGVDNPPPFDIPPEVFFIWLMIRGFCACAAFIYTTVLASVFIGRYSAAAAVYEIYDPATPDKYTNYRCLVFKTDKPGQGEYFE